ncbi:MAG: catechol 2,3-dioxygenase [Actinomycetota bacterium]|nr:catechol 2,3-dioxygenase [Actinomycetota bacterium]
MGILRLSHVEIRVPDLELATAYYSEVVGLIETAREADRVFLKCWDEHQHHSVTLNYASSYGLDVMGFKLQDHADLDHYQQRIEDAGIATKRFAAGELGPGSGETVRFEAPSGHTADLVFGMSQVGNMLPLTNPPPEPQGLAGIHPPRIDHIFLMCEDVDGATAFFENVLDFRLTEQILADDDHQICTFLERSHTPHDLAFITGPNGAFHHVAFWMDDWNDLRRAADICSYNGVPIDAGPTRHGATRGWGLYFFDPAGNRNEVYTGGYWADPDREPVTWTEGEMGRAVFYYEGQVNQRFLTVHS